MDTTTRASLATLPDSPQTGFGVHRFIFSAACTGVEEGLADFLIHDLIRDKTRDCGRLVTSREIEDSIRDARAKVTGAQTNRPAASGSRKAYTRPVSTPENPIWPMVNKVRQALIVKHGADVAALCDLADSALSRSEEEYVDALFPAAELGDPLLCVGKSVTQFATFPRSKWRSHLHRLQLIVPSPMTSRWGTKKDGGKSQHARDNTGPRRYIVQDFDWKNADDHAAILWFLNQKRPLKMAVHTGNRGLHGWFVARGFSEDDNLAFMAEAVALGADPRMWWREQFARIPGGWRDDAKAIGRHSVVYFNDQV